MNTATYINFCHFPPILDMKTPRDLLAVFLWLHLSVLRVTTAPSHRSFLPRLKTTGSSFTFHPLRSFLALSQAPQERAFEHQFSCTLGVAHLSQPPDLVVFPFLSSLSLSRLGSPRTHSLSVFASESHWQRCHLPTCLSYSTHHSRVRHEPLH